MKVHATFLALQKGAEDLLIRMPIRVCPSVPHFLLLEHLQINIIYTIHDYTALHVQYMHDYTHVYTIYWVIFASAYFREWLKLAPEEFFVFLNFFPANPLWGELLCKREPNNMWDFYAVAVIKDDCVVEVL